MPFVRVDPDNAAQVRSTAALLEAARQVDDPDNVPDTVLDLEHRLRYSWDLHPHVVELFTPDGAEQPVGVLDTERPTRDNRHLAVVDLVVHPEHRRHGHGSAMFAETVRQARAAGRTTLWLGCAADDDGAQAFLGGHGLVRATADARRRQVLAEVDLDEIARLEATATAAAAGYCLERRQPPTAPEVLAGLVEVTAAINDAPMGDLTFEEEVFDARRLQDFEQAQLRSDHEVCRLIARDATGRVGGHTLMIFNPRHPHVGWQGDTAVSREHRGHRLGLLLKIAMLRWVAEAKPQVQVIETWNNVDNHFMISVNERLGYRLNRVFATYQLTLTD